MSQAKNSFSAKLFFQIVTGFWALFSSLALAETAGKANTQVVLGEAVPQPGDYFSQILLSLIFILLIIFAAAWLLRRYGRFPGVADGNLRVLGALSVGPRERILLLQAGKEQIVVGVTSSKISKLHELSEPVDVDQKMPSSLGKGVFAQRLQEAMQGKLNPHKVDQTADKPVNASKEEGHS